MYANKSNPVFILDNIIWEILFKTPLQITEPNFLELAQKYSCSFMRLNEIARIEIYQIYISREGLLNSNETMRMLEILERIIGDSDGK
ncbi:Uncharacterised protein [Yersinia aldovae]|uniref:hypothetical protein n=1 Tax=Yersinia aldovae TaxID=29483 RepID=UPI0005DDD782|nr:hypothetical protein [Yersinia aldovae]CNK25589.1 Uncharacterised protein [Yersinia aldovae]